MVDVFIKKCREYDADKIKELVCLSLNGLGIDFTKEITGKKVLLKPNLLSAHHPDKAVTTHPVFIEAIVKILKDYDCEIWLGDSPNGVQKSLDDVLEKTGMRDLCKRYGLKEKPFEKGGASKVDNLLISNVVLEADYIINLPKLKTHGLTVFTCAVKNLYGYVPGLHKSRYHAAAKDLADFAKKLVTIAEVRRPDLTIVDGISAMAGNGPSGGYKIDTEIVIVGRDIYKIDLAVASLIGITPGNIDTLKAASDIGLVDLSGDILFAGNNLSDFDMSEFKLPVSYTTNLRNFGWFNFLIKHFMKRMKVRPRVDKSLCVKCGMCVKICPVKAIDFSKEFPFVDDKRCINCYCCHETCPEKAMELRESLVLKVMKKFSRN